MLSLVLPQNLFALAMVFTRLGGVVMLMPGVGDGYVTSRARLILALAIAAAVTPVLAPELPPEPQGALPLALLLGAELLIGLFLGTIARVFMSVLTTAGMIIASLTSLANALVNDPAAAQQGSIAGTFLAMTALVIIFALDIHHLMLAAVVDSYRIFAPGMPPPTGDMADYMAQLAGKSFELAVQMSAPFIVVGLVFYLGVGLLSRLMPQVQIFFVAMPVQIALGLVVLMLCLPTAMSWFAEAMETSYLGLMDAG